MTHTHNKYRQYIWQEIQTQSNISFGSTLKLFLNSIQQKLKLILSHVKKNNMIKICYEVDPSDPTELLKFFFMEKDKDEYQRITGRVWHEPFEYLIYDQECEGVCICGEESKGVDIFNWQDYCDNPMVWCESCCLRGFICPECPAVIIDTKIKGGEEFKTIELPLVRIRKVINHQIYNWQWTRELFEEHFEEFLKLNYFQDKEVRQFAEKIGLEEIRGNYDPKMKWDIYVECNNIDAEKCLLPIDMSHDGIYIYCDCKCDKCGYEFKTKYWGD